MSFVGSVTKGEKVVLIHKDSGKVIFASAVEDGKFQLGGSALFEVYVLKGESGVSQMTVNVNWWDVYKMDDLALTERLVTSMFGDKG